MLQLRCPSNLVSEWENIAGSILKPAMNNLPLEYKLSIYCAYKLPQEDTPDLLNDTLKLQVLGAMMTLVFDSTDGEVRT